jgi:osmotically-inducible protein OsmY
MIASMKTKQTREKKKEEEAMFGGVNRRAQMASIVVGAMLAAGLPAHTLFAQERQQHEGEQRQRAQTGRRDFTDQARDQAAESWMVIKLAARPGLNDLRVEVRNGVATLSGKAADEQTKQRALRIANSTMGVNSVRDQITIDKSLADRRQPNVNERDLAKQVAQKIAGDISGSKAGEDWWFEGWRVEGPYNRWNMVVEVSEPGRVVLEGDVPRVELARRAVEAARKVPGVRTVDSDLRIEPDYYHPFDRRPYGSDPYYGYGAGGFYHPHVLPPYARDRESDPNA